MPTSLSPGERLDLAAKILSLCRWERYAYLAVTLITSSVLVALGLKAVGQKTADASLAGTMFGSAGIVTLSVGRLLAVFNKVFKAVLES